MRLIDTDELIYMALGEDTEKPFRFVPLEFIEDVPTIDAVPVIRCKDCDRYFQKICHLTMHKRDETDFCSRAQRKEE